jgi:putative transposase
MRRSQHTDEEIAVLLDEAERGVPVDEICRSAHVSLRTFYRWKSRLGALPPPAIRRLKELEQENRELRRMLLRFTPVVPRLPDETRAPDGIVERLRTPPDAPAPSRRAAGYRTCRLG